jgi:16S rRNA (cytidine1402-2'-O)-methyltransferase
MTQPQLFILGTPLDETSLLAPRALEIVSKAHVIIGESRKLTARHCRMGKTPGAPRKTPVHLLEHATMESWKEIEHDLKRISKDHGAEAIAVLLSDTGMPILFDPGREVMDLARHIGFRVRTIPAATAWATAAALSGFLPPFYVADFLPRDPNERMQKLKQLSQVGSHCVIMDTPYRFRLLIDESRRIFGDTRLAFLAWDIARSSEQYIWGNLAQLSQAAKGRQLDKGEFVLIIKGSLEEKG